MCERSFVFRLNDGQGPELIRQVFLERGWREFEEDEDEECDWNLWWRSSRFRNCDYEDIYPWQRLNHYPKSTAITKKDSLARNLKRMKAVHGASAYNFSPLAFNLPNDYTKFVGLYSKSKDKDRYWICKPADMSRGRGIFLFRDLSELQYDCNAVVQEYITNPMLISGYKFDLRIYVLVPSFHPLQIYIYQEGLVRFSTEKFDLNALGNMYSHLTNTSINKHGPSYNLDKERVGPGCKWTITQLRHFFRQTLNIDDTDLWGKIINIVILTLLIQVSQVPKATNCFELYGFDILVDEKLKPWLLEVNFSPALSSDCQTDIIVKKPMLHDMIEMMCFTEEDMLRGDRLARNNPSRSMSLPAETRKRLSGHHHNYSAFSRRSKLPDLQRNNNDNTTDPSDEIQHVPLVPGCGLPSVQQPISNYHYNNNYHRRYSSDSGHSSGSPDFMDPYPRIPAIKTDQTASATLRSRKAPVVKPRTLRSLTKPPGSSNNNNSKRVSSDSSGVSTFSASSDNSETTSNNLKKQSSHIDLNGNSIKLINQRKTIRTETKPRVASFNGRPSKSFLINSTLSSKSMATQQKLTAYAKPWKERSSDTSEIQTKPLLSSVGNFILVWPFNDVSRKCSMNPDPRIVIKECQKLLRERNNKPQMWGPLLATETT